MMKQPLEYVQNSRPTAVIFDLLKQRCKKAAAEFDKETDLGFYCMWEFLSGMAELAGNGRIVILCGDFVAWMAKCQVDVPLEEVWTVGDCL